MKVYIGPYKNWVGPYQIAEALCFWAKPEKDEYNFKRKPDWVHDFGTWLSHGTTDEKITDSKNPPKTWLLKLCQWVESKRSRNSYIKIDKYDTWSMDHTLAMIVLPMLKQLQATKHGGPHVDDEDVPEELKSTSAPAKENEYDTDENHFKRWDWALNEMIWAFEQNLDTNSEDKFFDHEEWDPTEKDFNTSLHKIKIDQVGLKAHQDRKANGFRLFGKYYQGLWD